MVVRIISARIRYLTRYHPSISILQSVKSRMALEFMFVVSCLLLLQASEAVSVLTRQASPPLNRDCSEQEEQNLLNAFPQDCRAAYNVLDFTNVQTIISKINVVDPMTFTMLCSEACSPRALDHLEGCYGTTSGLAQLFRAVCISNMNGTMCYTIVV